jgi:SET domain-containing protein
MPAFEGLFPAEYDALVQDLLFELAAWHAFAKMRMHTDSTLGFLEAVTTSLGHTLRRFAAEVCSKIQTHALPREEEASQRRAARAAAKKQKATASDNIDPSLVSNALIVLLMQQHVNSPFPPDITLAVNSSSGHARCSSNSSSGCTCHSCTRCKVQRPREKVQPLDLQVACSRRLCEDHPTVRHNRQLFDTDGM